MKEQKEIGDAFIIDLYNICTIARENLRKFDQLCDDLWGIYDFKIPWRRANCSTTVNCWIVDFWCQNSVDI